MISYIILHCTIPNFWYSIVKYHTVYRINLSTKIMAEKNIHKWKNDGEVEKWYKLGKGKKRKIKKNKSWKIPIFRNNIYRQNQKRKKKIGESICILLFHTVSYLITLPLGDQDSNIIKNIEQIKWLSRSNRLD